MIKIKADEDIFNEAISLSHRMNAWASYVQNDMELTQEDIKTFLNMSNKHIDELHILRTKILKHIKECNG